MHELMIILAGIFWFSAMFLIGFLITQCDNRKE
nr:MAG TPA: hypothetical protein [Caudoviricetes sp.]